MDLKILESISQIVANIAIIGTFALAAIETWEKRKKPRNRPKRRKQRR